MTTYARLLPLLLAALSFFMADAAFAGDFDVLDAAVTKIQGLVTTNLMTAVTGIGGGMIALAGAAFGFRWVQRMFY